MGEHDIGSRLYLDDSTGRDLRNHEFMIQSENLHDCVE